MDLLLISRCPPFPLYRGDRLIPHHVARELAARGHTLDLLAFYQEPSDPADLPQYERLFRSVKLIPEPKRSKLSLWQRARQPALRFPETAVGSWSPAMWEAIQEARAAHTYDVAHLFGGVHVYEFWQLVKDLPNVVVPYESYALWLERAALEKPLATRWIHRLQHRLARNFESWMFEPYDRTVLLTDLDARAVQALNPCTRTSVIPNGVDLAFFEPVAREPEEAALLFIGNYDYAPNLDAAVRLARDIFPRVKQVEPQARLYLVGGGAPRSLRALAGGDIVITGHVPDTRTYLAMAAVFISPLRLGAGIKNKVLEAMAMRVPVVASPLSCDGIPVQHGQQVLLGETDEELAAAAVRVLADARLRAHLRERARRLVEEQFTWARVAEHYEALYKQVIAERKAAGGAVG